MIGLDDFAGLNTSLVPMYISEIAPLTLRGGLGTVNQLAVTVGLLISQILGIEGLLGTDDGWPILLGFAVLPVKINFTTKVSRLNLCIFFYLRQPALQLILLPFCPESPRYLLISRQQETLARNGRFHPLCSSNLLERMNIIFILCVPISFVQNNLKLVFRPSDKIGYTFSTEKWPGSLWLRIPHFCHLA